MISFFDVSNKLRFFGQKFIFGIWHIFGDFWLLCSGGTFSPCPSWLDGYLQRIVTIFRHALKPRDWEMPLAQKYFSSICAFEIGVFFSGVSSSHHTINVFNGAYFWAHSIFWGDLACTVFENDPKSLTFVSEASYDNFQKKPWVILFCPSQILLNSCKFWLFTV